MSWVRSQSRLDSLLVRPRLQALSIPVPSAVQSKAILNSALPAGSRQHHQPGIRPHLHRQLNPVHPNKTASRRHIMSSGPRPPSKAELARPSTPSILSRAGSPTLPLGSLYESSRRQSSSGEPRPDPNGGEGEVDSGEQSGNGLRQGEFIGSVDCGTT